MKKKTNIVESYPELLPHQSMTRDIKDAALLLTDEEARYLVDSFYQMQDDRIRSNNRARSMEDSEEPNAVISWLAGQSEGLESQIKLCLARYVRAHPMGEWLISIKGIGTVLAAGLLANIDITKAKTAGAIWRYAGYDPTSKWEKGKIRPWNASLKVLCWKIGCSFVKVSGYDDAFYGKLYQERKQYEVERNESGKNAEAAKLALSTKNIDKTTDAYKAYILDKLPAAHVDARARRWVVKLFLAHLFEVWYEKHHGKAAPLPYPEAHLQHVHIINAPK